ncbi:MAG: hypothetical protein BMS9Abin36_0306 [Gammaproteobacteria bacterium]|nr:MAG: hypothetical protein BMS9Abin36_0306 [Gammaproteobacteria bacterium]
MSSGATYLAGVIILALLVATSLWLNQVFTTPTVINQGEAKTHEYTMEYFTATVMNKQGRPIYTLTANSLHESTAGQGAVLDQPRLVQYSETESPVYTRADRGYLSKDRKHITMQGHVKVTRRASTDKPDEAHGVITTRELEIALE